MAEIQVKVSRCLAEEKPGNGSESQACDGLFFCSASLITSPDGGRDALRLSYNRGSHKSVFTLSSSVAATHDPPCLSSARECEDGVVTISNPRPLTLSTPPLPRPQTNIQDPHFSLTILSNSLIEKLSRGSLP